MRIKRLCNRARKIITKDRIKILVKDSFCFCYSINLIVVPQEYDHFKPTNCIFADLCARLGLGELNPYLSSLLHELGHYFTHPFHTEEDIRDYECGNDIINMFIDGELASLETISDMYYQLDIEKSANDIAVELFNENREALLKINKKFNKLFPY